MMDPGLRGFEMDRCEDIRNHIIRVRPTARRSTAPPPPAEGDDEDDDDHRRSSTISPALPKIKFPVFNGDYIEWLPWWNRFKAAIHENRRLHEIDKFNLLKSYTGGRAAEAIRSRLVDLPRTVPRSRRHHGRLRQSN